jgi:hypothetical protein
MNKHQRNQLGRGYEACWQASDSESHPVQKNARNEPTFRQ